MNPIAKVKAAKKERTTITFQPERDVCSLLSKAINAKVGRGGRKLGVRSRIINDLLRRGLAGFRGKREEAAV